MLIKVYAQRSLTVLGYADRLAYVMSGRYGFYGLAWPEVLGRVNAGGSGGVPLALIRYARQRRRTRGCVSGRRDPYGRGGGREVVCRASATPTGGGIR
jgi:hypothetical protein